MNIKRKLLINDLINKNLKNKEEILDYLEMNKIENSENILEDLKNERIRRIEEDYYVHSLS